MTGAWRDRPCVVVGTGASLKGFDLGALNDARIRVVAVKNAVYHLPFAALGFGGDTGWMRREKKRLVAQNVPLVLAVPFGDPRKGRRVITGAQYVDRVPGAGLCEAAPAVHLCGSSGYGALNYVFHQRPPLIVLLGFDYGSATAPRVGDHLSDAYAEHHYFDPALYKKVKRRRPRWSAWAQAFDLAAPALAAASIQVLNGAPCSRITAFPRLSPDAALAAALSFKAPR